MKAQIHLACLLYHSSWQVPGLVEHIQLVTFKVLCFPSESIVCMLSSDILFTDNLDKEMREWYQSAIDAVSDDKGKFGEDTKC